MKRGYFGILFVLPFVMLIFSGSLRAEAVLTVTNIEIVPDFPQPGGYVTAKFTVKNTGNSAVPGAASLAAEVYSCKKNGVRIAGDYQKIIPWYANNINALQPNASQVISKSFRLEKEGYHTVSAVILSEGYSLEQLRVAAGQDKKLFYVSRPADLVLENVSLDHSGRLILTMFNDGAAIPDEHFNASEISVKIAAGTFRVRLRDAASKTLQMEKKQGVLGIPVRHRYIWKATGESGFTLQPNLQNKVEVDLDNNQAILDNRRFNNKKTVWVGGKADLVVCFKKYNHNKPHRNAYYPPVVKNIGYAASERSKLRFWIKDDGVKTYNIPPLEPGQEYRGVQRRVYWVRVKSHRFRLTVDNNNDVDELIENNNVIEGIITVGKYGNNSQTLCSDAPGMTGFD